MIFSFVDEFSSWRERVSLRRPFATLVVVACAWFGSELRVQAQTNGAELLDKESFLRAISEVETGGNSRAIGRAGERGMYQFSRQTWRQHTSRSFHDAHNPLVSKQIARMHFDWLEAGFRRNGRTPNSYMMAAAWNAGLSRTLSGRIPRSTVDYAKRVTNIVAATAPSRDPFNQRRLFVASSAE
jgi:soluble lytic murein transglycosylase-like protein